MAKPENERREEIARTPITHDLKTWPEYFQAVKLGAKQFELRANDRDFRVGDTLRLREWCNVGEAYTGDEVSRIVSYVLADGPLAVPGFVVLSLALPPLPPRGEEPVAWRPIAEHDGSDESVLAICASAYTPTAFEAWLFDGKWWLYSRGGEKQSSGVTAWFPTHWMPKPARHHLAIPAEAQARIERLHPATRDLVDRFAAALAEKLAKAEAKYGYTDGWLSANWEADCREALLGHIDKGDPRDVAAYCAFMWHHGWSTSAGSTPKPSLVEITEEMAERLGGAREIALEMARAGERLMVSTKYDRTDRELFSAMRVDADQIAAALTAARAKDGEA